MKFNNPDIFERKILGGVTLSAQYLKDLKGGRTILVKNMKGQTYAVFSQYVKMNETTNRPDFYKYNPDSPEDKL